MKRLLSLLLVMITLAACQPAPATPAQASPEDSPTATARPELTEAQLPTLGPGLIDAGIEAQVAALAGLEIDVFFEESFLLLALRTPEMMVEQRLDRLYGLHIEGLNDVSYEYALETGALAQGILDQLHEYDRAALNAEDQLSYDVYEWFLLDTVEHTQYLLYEYPVSFMLTGVQMQTELFFNDNHPLETAQDVEDYLARLWLVDEKFAQASDFMALQAAQGITPPGVALTWTIFGIDQMANALPFQTPYYTALEEKIGGVPDMTQEEKDAALGEALEAISTAVIPAYDSLKESLTLLQSAPAPQVGVGQFEGGAAYYDYALRHYNTSGLSADEIHALGFTELERIHVEMRAAFADLGYPADESLVTLYERAALAGGIIPAERMLPTYTQIIEDAQIAYDFIPIRPEADVIVRGDSYGGFYVPAALDGSRPGVFFANVSTEGALYRMRSLAYHEAVPGHHTQLAIQQEMDLPTFRKVVGFTGYIEGWALYAERLVYEEGWYENDPYGNLGRLQYEAFRAARLVVDTGIHSKGWSFGQAVDFFSENTGFSEGFAENEIGRYMVWPGQATAYMVGMLEILRLRGEAEAALGPDFDRAEFHRVLLGSGSMPLDLLERVVYDWIESQQ